MKLLKLTFLVALVVSFSACDDSEDCIQNDWTGTYTGTQSCDGGAASDIDVEIIASGDDAIIVKTTQTDNGSTLTTELDPIEFDGCSIDLSESGSGITVTFDFDIDGDNLTLIETFADGTSTSTCTTTATRN